MIAADTFMVVFRTLHIVAGVLWVGATFLFVVYLQPAAAEVGPAAAPVMGNLLGKRRMVDGILAVALVTVVTGLIVYWHDWHLYDSFGAWISTPFGASLTFGAVCAIVAMGFGLFVSRPSAKRLMALGQMVAASGGPPSPEVAGEIASLQHRLKVFARLGFALLVIAVIAMASARYS
jgi:uncharacterized membrane protein